MMREFVLSDDDCSRAGRDGFSVADVVVVCVGEQDEIGLRRFGPDVGRRVAGQERVDPDAGASGFDFPSGVSVVGELHSFSLLLYSPAGRHGVAHPAPPVNRRGRARP